MKTPGGQAAGAAARYLRRSTWRGGLSRNPPFSSGWLVTVPVVVDVSIPPSIPPTQASPTIPTMVRPASRFAQSLRHRLQFQQTRFASTNPSTEAAQKKAQDALASAQKFAGQAVEKGRKFLGPAGDKLANAFGAYREPLVYNFQVARELLKQIYVAERLQPPSLSTIQNAYSTIWSRASNPAYWREVLRTGEYAKIGVYALEAYGIFKIGEIIGRRSLVGYNIQ